MRKIKIIYVLGGVIVLILIIVAFSVFGPKRIGKSCLSVARRTGIKSIVHEPVIPRHLFPSQENCEHNTRGACLQLSEALPNLQEPAGSPYEGYDWVSPEYIESELLLSKYFDLIENNSCRKISEFREDPHPRAVDDEQSEHIYHCPEDGLFLIGHSYFNLQDLYVFDQNPCDLDTN